MSPGKTLDGIDALRALHAASQRLNYPGANKLYSHLRNEGDRVKFKDVQAFSERQPARQIFAETHNVRYKRGTRGAPAQGFSVPAININDRWMADLADLTAQPSIPAEHTTSLPPYQYILVVINVFSKELFARALRTKTPQTVALAFKEILQGQHAPSRLDTDAGAEFTGAFHELMEQRHIWHVVRDPEDVNVLSPVDRAIATLKRSIFRRVVADRDKDWAESLQATVQGYNETEHRALQGRTPEEVKDDPELQFMLRRANSEAMVRNSALINARDKKLVEKGAFRVQDPNRFFGRSYQPRYGNEVHEVQEVKGGVAVDTEGKVFKTRHTLAVPSGSAPASHTEEMRGGSALIERKQREAIAPFKERVLAHLGAGPKWLHEMAEYMKLVGMTPLMKSGLNYKKALTLFGLHVDERGKVTPAESARPRLAPAQAAAALAAPAVRRRLVGKQPGVTA